jgi:hypothetical protein
LKLKFAFEVVVADALRNTSFTGAVIMQSVQNEHDDMIDVE